MKRTRILVKEYGAYKYYKPQVEVCFLGIHLYWTDLDTWETRLDWAQFAIKDYKDKINATIKVLEE